MLKALNTAATGMSAQEKNVNTISNNIANVNTVGYKKARTEFEDLLYETIQEPGSRSSQNTQNNVGVQIGTGSKVSGIKKEFSQGSPLITNNPFDLMINGDGFFGVMLPNNDVHFTRNGSFNVDAQGNLVTKKGFKVFPGISVPPNATSVEISENGNVDVYTKGQLEPSNVGTIPVFTFTNPVGLKNQGGNLMSASGASGAPVQNLAGQNQAGNILQGSLEASNVNIMNEMTNLIKAQRAYETNSKVMGVADQMLGAINNTIR